MLDACVLVQAPVRDTLLRMAEAPRLFRPVWSSEILEEMRRTLVRRFGLAPAKVDYLEAAMARYFPGAHVSGFESVMPLMTNHPGDRHVLAAAVQAQAPLIVTYNLRHFPSESVDPWNIEVLHPGEFLERAYRSAPWVVRDRLRQQSATLRRSFDEQLDVLAQAVPSFVRLVRSREAMTGPLREP